jgi:hypothetical protein
MQRVFAEGQGMSLKNVPTLRSEDAVEVTDRARRPFGLWAVIVLHFLKAILNLAIVALSLLQDSALVTLVLSDLGDESQVLRFVVTSALLALFSLVAGIGMLRLRRWAWILTMILLAYSMTRDILAFYNGLPSYTSMALNVIQVAYLNQHEVQSLFGEGTAKEASWRT